MTTKSSIRSNDSTHTTHSNHSIHSTSSISSGRGSTPSIPGLKSLKSVSDSALLSGVRKLSHSELRTVLRILVHLIEIERRQLYLEEIDRAGYIKAI